MTLSELQAYIGEKLGDPNHDRYGLSLINQELENTQTAWNVEIGIVRDSIPLVAVAGTRQYSLFDLTGTPICFPRVTFAGNEIKQKDVSFLDTFTADDWTDDVGTPKYFVIEATDPDELILTVYPTPGDADAGEHIVVTYGKQHTPMSAASDVPFMSGTSSNYLLRPYDFYLCFDAMVRILAGDPSEGNAKKMLDFRIQANEGKAQIIQVFKSLEKEVPMRLRGGRTW